MAGSPSASRYQLWQPCGQWLYPLDANIAQPVHRKIVGVSKTVTHIKTEIIQKHVACIMRKIQASLITDAVVFAVDMKAVQMIIVPTHGGLNDMMKICQ